jgi:uncharacterized protein YecT (DUF1311 family)
MKLFISALLFVPVLSYAVSFDCNLAKTNIEKTICSSKELGNLDDQLAAKYGEAKSALDESKGKILLNDQRSWLSGLRKSCENSKSPQLCISELYKNRLVSLNNYLGEKYLPHKPEINAVCEYSANLKSEDFLDLKDGVPVDINNDGDPEYPKGVVYGAQLEWDFYSKNGDRVSLGINVNDEYIDYFSRNIFSYNGINYFTLTNDDKRKIIFVGKNFTGYQLCEFGKSISKELVISNSEICSNIQKGGVKYIVPDLQSNMKSEWAPGADIIPDKAIKIDIDNDKDPEYLQQYILASSRHGCDYRYYELINADLSSKSDNPLNDLLRSYGSRCWASVDLISYLGENYIQYNLKEQNSTLVFKIENGKMKKYCDFEHKMHYKLLHTIELL